MEVGIRQSTLSRCDIFPWGNADWSLMVTRLVRTLARHRVARYKEALALIESGIQTRDEIEACRGLGIALGWAIRELVLESDAPRGDSDDSSEDSDVIRFSDDEMDDTRLEEDDEAVDATGMTVRWPVSRAGLPRVRRLLVNQLNALTPAQRQSFYRATVDASRRDNPNAYRDAASDRALAAMLGAVADVDRGRVAAPDTPLPLRAMSPESLYAVTMVELIDDVRALMFRIAPHALIELVMTESRLSRDARNRISKLLEAHIIEAFTSKETQKVDVPTDVPALVAWLAPLSPIARCAFWLAARSFNEPLGDGLTDPELTILSSFPRLAVHGTDVYETRAAAAWMPYIRDGADPMPYVPSLLYPVSRGMKYAPMPEQPRKRRAQNFNPPGMPRRRDLVRTLYPGLDSDAVLWNHECALVRELCERYGLQLHDPRDDTYVSPREVEDWGPDMPYTPLFFRVYPRAMLDGLAYYTGTRVPYMCDASAALEYLERTRHPLYARPENAASADTGVVAEDISGGEPRRRSETADEYVRRTLVRNVDLGHINAVRYEARLVYRMRAEAVEPVPFAAERRGGVHTRRRQYAERRQRTYELARALVYTPWRLLMFGQYDLETVPFITSAADARRVWGLELDRREEDLRDPDSSLPPAGRRTIRWVTRTTLTKDHDVRLMPVAHCIGRNLGDALVRAMTAARAAALRDHMAAIRATVPDDATPDYPPYATGYDRTGTDAVVMDMPMFADGAAFEEPRETMNMHPKWARATQLVRRLHTSSVFWNTSAAVGGDSAGAPPTQRTIMQLTQSVLDPQPRLVEIDMELDTSSAFRWSEYFTDTPPGFGAEPGLQLFF